MSQEAAEEIHSWVRTLRFWRHAAIFVLLAFFVAFPGAAALGEEPDPDEPAEIRVRGYGFFGNRDLMRTLEMLFVDEPPPLLSATDIEDGVLILLARVQGDGYLRPEIEVSITRDTGEVETYRGDDELLTELPRPTNATRVEYTIEAGVLYHYHSLEFEGLTVLDDDEARDYFYPSGFLVETRRMRTFTPEGLEQGARNIQEVLVRRGYEQARVEVEEEEIDDESGEVRVRIRVEEGPQSFVREIRTVIVENGTEEEIEDISDDEQPYSRRWARDVGQELRTRYLRQGCPDTRLEIEVDAREADNGRVWVDLTFRVTPGPFVEVGEVVFRGHERTRESPLRRRVELSSGDPLDRVELDRARFRLARLGVFETVEVEFEEAEEGRRNVVFNLEEGPAAEVNLLLGYGSYEMLRGGIEVEQFNIFGRAHRSRLLLTQSLRSSSGNYTYRVPELFGEEIHGFSQLFGLRREEPDFDRVEFGASVGIQTLLRGIDTDARLRYTLEELQTRRFFVAGEGVDRARVGSMGLDLRRDRRDNPIYPEEGHSISTRFEVAARQLGGEVAFQRLEAGVSQHWPIGGGRYIHAAVHHGVVHTFGDVAEDLPFNRRFFTGGESTVRGFTEGRASARDDEGRLVGSETYSLLNVEFEQAITPQWSVVAFSDSIAFARRFNDYPFDDALYSVGVGVRYKTFIGPLRLEYGHNLNPRDEDPRRALHLSLGFPF